MTPEQESRVEALFQEYADLPEDVRESLLARLASDDAVVHAELVALLHHDRSDDTNVREMLQAAADAYIRAQDAAFIGQRVGRWRILRNIGAGGMGRVYLAERDDRQFQQHVAVKLLDVGATTPATRARFQRECQMLADLNHPNIAHLFDGGITDDGIPFLVMEYIDGLPIDRFIAEHALTLHQRLRLFITLCNAVQSAHQRLIVHCDIKPSNILVTTEGIPKLLDFGIGTMLGRGEPGSGAAPGADKLRIMTPEHASPEQARGEPVTTAADVYALGILLYMLLSRRPPYRLDMSSGREQLMRSICESVAEPPSITVDDELWPGDRTSSSHRSVKRLRNLLVGDLDAIVLKALQKNPAERYGSARELAEDIENHLAHRPVTSRPDSVGYRARRYVRRHTIGVTLSAAILAVSIGFAITSTVQAQRIDRERLLAERVTDFLVNLFASADPHVQPEQVTARHLLDEGTRSIDTDLADEPVLQARLQTTIGRAYRNLGLYPQAQSAIEHALARQSAVAGESHGSVADLYYELGLTKRDAGDYQGARDAHRQGYEMHVRNSGENDVGAARSLAGVAVMNWQLGEYGEATRAFERALPILVANLGNEHPDVIAARHNLALVFEKVGEYGRAFEIEAEVLAALRRKHGEVHPKVATVLNLMGALEAQRGNHRPALDLFRQALRIDEQVLGPTHPYVAFDLEALGNHLFMMGEYAEAASVVERAIAIRESNGEKSTPDLAYALVYLGALRLEQDDVAAAQRHLERARVIYEKEIGTEHENYAELLGILGAVETKLGRHAQAIQLHERALEISKAVLGAGHAIVGETLMDVARAHAAGGDLEAAEKLARSAVEIVARGFGDDNVRTHAARASYARTLAQSAPSPRAAALLREEIAFLEGEFGAAHPDIAELCTSLAGIDAPASAPGACTLKR